MTSISLKDYARMVLFSYTTKHLLKKDKIRFYYALKGRDGKSGIIKLYKASHLSRAVLLVRDKASSDVEDFLKYWKCKYIGRDVFVRKS